MFQLNVKYLINLAKMEVLITDDSLLNRFKLLINGCANTIQSLNIKFLATNEITMNELVMNTLNSICTLKKLTKLQIELYYKPINGIVKENNKINLTKIIDSISENEILTNQIKDSFNLVIDVNHVQLAKLNLIKCLNAFDKTNSLSVLIYNDKRTSLDEFKVNFNDLKFNFVIKHFKINYSNFSNKDFTDIIIKYRKLLTFDIACGDRLTKFNFPFIRRQFLQVLSIDKSFGFHGIKLPINDFTLNGLFDYQVELSSLRTLKFANCKIEFSNQTLIKKICQMAEQNPDEMYKITLFNNKFPIMKLSNFLVAYEIPNNLKLRWYWEHPFTKIH